MSLLETVRGRAKAAQPGDLMKELVAAKAQLVELEGQRGVTALDAFNNEPGAASRLEALNRQLAAGRERAQTLEAAHAASIEREQAATLAQRAALQAAQRKAAIGHLRARDAAGAALSEHLEKAAEQYRILIERSEKAQAACPVMTQWPDSSLCGSSVLTSLVQNEMYRVSAKTGRDPLTLPGSQHPHVNLEWNPKGIKALGDQLKAASEFVIAKLTGKAQPE